MRHTTRLVGQYGTPVLFLSRRRLLQNLHALRAALPHVELFYAVKSNPCAAILSALKKAECGFDVCTAGEIEAVRAEGIRGDHCIHTHPIKTDAELRAALDFGIDLFVIDNEDEIAKLRPYRKRLRALVRISIQNPTCVVNLSHKFGIAPAAAFDLIQKARGQGVEVAGLSFHVGSQNENPMKFIEALEYCRDICRMSTLAGIPLEIIDIGGGFPISYRSGVVPLDHFCRPVQEYLDRFFAGYRLVAEPGRFICGTAITLAAGIIGKSMRNGVRWYYLNDGLYGSFSGKIYDHADYPMYVPRPGRSYSSTIAGPTCDSIDVLYENIPLPELEIGDFLLFGSMGAYTSASAGTFNGIPKTRTVVVS